MQDLPSKEQIIAVVRDEPMVGSQLRRAMGITKHKKLAFKQLLAEMVKYEFLPDPFPDLTLRSYVLKNRERALKIRLAEAHTACATATDKQVRDEQMKLVIELTKELENLKKEMEKIQTEYAGRNVTLNKQKSKRTQEE